MKDIKICSKAAWQQAVEYLLHDGTLWNQRMGEKLCYFLFCYSIVIAMIMNGIREKIKHSLYSYLDKNKVRYP